MRKFFYPFILIACLLPVFAPATAEACPKHKKTPCTQPQTRPLPPAVIAIEVTETFSVVVYDYDCVWEWDRSTQEWRKRWIVVGWHYERRTETRWVTAHWNDAFHAFTYYDRDGNLQVVRR